MTEARHLRIGLFDSQWPDESLGGTPRIDIDQMTGRVTAAESCGLDSFGFGERHFGVGALSHPLVVASSLFARTTRISLCPLVVLPLHHPIDIAEQVTLLESMYPGRMRLAVGAGYLPVDFDTFDVSLDDRTIVYEDGLVALERFQSGEAHTLRGRPWGGRISSLDELDGRLDITGQPLRGNGRVEVFVGAWSSAGVRRAARLADGWLTDPQVGIDRLRALSAVYVSECSQLGKRPRMILFRDAWIAETDSEAEAAWASHALAYARYAWDRGGTYAVERTRDPLLRRVGTSDELTFEHLRDRVLCGSPKTWLRRINQWVDDFPGLEELMVRIRFSTGPDVGQQAQALKLISAHVSGNVPVRAGAS